jgi:hypothetical protein
VHRAVTRACDNLGEPSASSLPPYLLPKDPAFIIPDSLYVIKENNMTLYVI